MSELKLEPIGRIESPYIDKFGTPRQGGLTPASLARVVLRSDLQPAEMLEGLEGFSHIWLISYFHANENKQPLVKVNPPRLGGKSVGVLATRSPHHPNSLGLTLARLERFEKDSIWVSGIDLIDGTPILDIKPYLPSLESVPAAREGWLAENPWPVRPVNFTPRFLRALEQISRIEAPPMDDDRFMAIIRESLQQDPRPRTAKHEASRSYWLRLYDFDIEFTYGESTVEVIFIRFAFHSSKYALFKFEEQQHQ